MGGLWSRTREDSGRKGDEAAGAPGRGKEGGAGGARTPAHRQGLGVAALVHQLAAVLGQGLQLRLVTRHPQEPGQLLHHRHQVLEDKSRAREPVGGGAFTEHDFGYCMHSLT